LTPETFEIRALANDVLAAIRPLAEKNGNTLQTNCPADLGLIRTDVGKLRQMLINLLNNAAKFTQQGTITLTITRAPGAPSWSATTRAGDEDTPAETVAAGDEIVFQVEDTGFGMTQEQMTHLFQPFMPGDSSSTRKHGGTGLGLALCYRLSQMMGGDISAESQPHQGSIFTLRLPAEVPERKDKPEAFN